MFTGFFYLLRARGLQVSINEWVLLLTALMKGLHRSSLTGFYHLCRSIVVHSETDFDKFDQAFLEYFRGVPFDGELPQELMEWLDRPALEMQKDIEALRRMGFPEEKIEELLRLLEERIREQDSEHNGGSKWVGTGGTSPFGHGGWHPNGIRIGGEGRYRTAMSVAGERNYRDFRRDNTLDTRQFQMAFRMLRQFSELSDTNEKEFDIDGTIRDTCDSAGTLKIRYKKPRRNTMKVLLFMDNGGSMRPHAAVCSRLFRAAGASNHLKELQTWYFHNCIYETVYTDPGQRRQDALSLTHILQNYDETYRVIIVGDAEMNPYELYSQMYNWVTGKYDEAGIKSLERMKQHFPYLIWLNPEPLPKTKDFWSMTHLALAEMFPMYELTVEGMEQGFKRLLRLQR